MILSRNPALNTTCNTNTRTHIILVDPGRKPQSPFVRFNRGRTPRKKLPTLYHRSEQTQNQKQNLLSHSKIHFWSTCQQFFDRPKQITTNLLTNDSNPPCIYPLAELQTIVREYWNRMFLLEGDKYDLERGEKLKQFEVKFSKRLVQIFTSLPNKILKTKNKRNKRHKHK